MNTVKTNILNGQFPAGTLILGIGGGGANFLDYVQKNSPQPIRCIACDTKPEGIAYAQGKGLATLYLGKVQDIPTTPKKAEAIAQANIDMIDKVLKDTKHLLVFATLGGNTGTGVAPIVVERALDLEIPVKVALTIPFSFEGKERRKHALAAAASLKKKVADTLVFDMNSLKKEVGNYGVGEGFAEIDKRIWEHLLESLTTNP